MLNFGALVLLFSLLPTPRLSPFLPAPSGAPTQYSNSLPMFRKRQLREWGPCVNNPAIDTAILSRALAELTYFSTQPGQQTHANGNQTLVIDGAYFDRGCNFNNPTWPTSNGKGFWLTIEINGRMDISQPWVIPDEIALVGVNEKVSAPPASFQNKPNSLIVCQQTTASPCITMGSGYVANLHILASGNANSSVLFGGAAKNGGAIARLDNVAISCQTSNAACVPLTFDGFQWAWGDHVHLSQGTTSPRTPASLHLTNSGKYLQQTGNLHFNHATLVGAGILWDSPGVAMNTAGATEFNDFVFESMSGGSGLAIQADQIVNVGSINARQWIVADSWGTCTFNIKGYGPTSGNLVQAIRSESVYNGAVWCSNGSTTGNGQQIYGAHFGDDTYTVSVAMGQLPTAMKHYIREQNGTVDAEWSGQGTYPMAIPFGTLNINQTARTWASTAKATVIAGIPDPWGGTNAARFTYAGNNGAWLLYDDGTRTVAAGDWLIYGACLRPDPASSRAYANYPLMWVDQNNAVSFDDAQASHVTYLWTSVESANMVGNGWECVAKATKVTTGGKAHLQFNIAMGSGAPIWISMPWAMYVPQATASALGDREIIRWSRTLRAVPSNAIAGEIYTPGGIPLHASTSNEVRSSSSSAGHVMCWKDSTHPGYCSSQPESNGTCRCN